jgi:MFS family permease
VTIVAYTLSCPVIGLLAKRERIGPRAVIVIGLIFQLIGFLLVGPSPLLQQEQMGMPQMVLALILFGVGEAMSQTPLMDDMMLSCRRHAEEASVTIAPLIMSSFALGQMIGPLIGSSASGRMGFPWACTLMASLLLAHLAVIAIVSAVRPRKAMKNRAYVGVELTPVSVPMAESAAE